MRSKATMLLTTLVAIGLSAGQAFSGTVCGFAQNAQGAGVSGVGIQAKDASGRVLGEATTGNNGEYRIDNVSAGTVDLFLVPGASGMQGGSGVLTMDATSRMVNWQVSNGQAAVASQSGVCGAAAGALTPAEWASIGVLGLGVAGGAAAIAWAESGNRSDSVKPISPQY